MLNFKPQKGKAFDALPRKTLDVFDNTQYLVSTKYDGNQIFITKTGGEVRWFTSDWKEFTLDIELPHLPYDYCLVGEFMYDSEGKLGDRRKSAILTTLRTNFKKGIKNNIDLNKVRIKLFDIVSEDLVNCSYSVRIRTLKHYIVPYRLQPIDVQLMTGKQAQEYTKELVRDGWEGCMLVEPSSTYHVGKRVNHSIKLKHRKTTDLMCIGTELAEPGSQFDGKIGSLLLEDSKGRRVLVGSGLTPQDRDLEEFHYVGNIIEIEYEQIMDTYIQPTFITIRRDKHVSD